MELSTEIDLGGLDETSESVTSLGQALEGLVPLAKRMSEVLGGMESGFADLSKAVDESISIVDKKTKLTEEEQAKKQAEQAKKKQEQEESRLQEKMASMIGGGVNTAAYELQLKKVKDQIDLINEAQQKRLITDSEAERTLDKLYSQQRKITREAMAYHAAGEGWTGRLAADATAKWNNLFGAGANVVKGQAQGVVSGVGGLLKGLPFLSGGLFGLLMGGIMNTDKIRGETAELANIARVTGRNISDSAISSMGAFQQQATHLFGISKGEFQGTYKAFVDAGIGIDQVLKKQAENLGSVGEDVAHLSFGIDKMYKLASGTSARAIVSLTVDYGMSVKHAGEMYEKLAFAGEKSKVGTQNFINYVMQGAGALRQYGVSVESVATTLQTIQSKYEQLGMPKQLAGSMAGESLSQLTQGLAGMGAGMQAYFGEHMGLGTGLQARQNFREGMGRLGTKGGDEFFEKLLKEEYNLAMQVSHGDKAQARNFLENSQGLGFQGAKALMEIGATLQKGGKLSEGTPEQIKALKETFDRSKDEQGRLANDMYNITQGLAGIGQGILGVITNLLGLGIVGLRWVWAKATGKETESTIKLMGDYVGHMNKSWDGIVAGAKQAGGGLGDQVGNILGPVKDALSPDLFGKTMTPDLFGKTMTPGASVDLQPSYTKMQEGRAEVVAKHKKAVEETGNPYASSPGSNHWASAFSTAGKIADKSNNNMDHHGPMEAPSSPAQPKTVTDSPAPTAIPGQTFTAVISPAIVNTTRPATH